jgi:hypothetical protein
MAHAADRRIIAFFREHGIGSGDDACDYILDDLMESARVDRVDAAEPSAPRRNPSRS